MTRMTKRLRDQLVDIEKARRKKAGKRGYSDADLAAVRAVTARLQEGLKPRRPAFDSATLQSLLSQHMTVWSKHLAAQITAPSYYKNLNAIKINKPQGVLILDDLHMAPILGPGPDRDDMVDVFRYAAFPTAVIDRGADFGVVRTDITA